MVSLEKIIKIGKRFFQAGALSLVLYGCDCCPSMPPKPEPPPEKPIETKKGVTDSMGQISFTDNSTLEEVILNVVDKQDNSPLQNMQVTYWDGEEFEVFLIDNTSNEYLPSIGIYPHNSTHTIETGKFGEGIYKIYTIDENNSLGKVVWSWKSESGMGGFSTYNYYKTVDYEESIEINNRQKAIIDFLWDGVEWFLGDLLPVKPSKIIEYLVPEEENPPQRWDVYTYKDGHDQNSSLTLIPSNIPTVEINNMNINEFEANVSWVGTDKDTYEQLVFLLDNKDITKYLDGNSTSDLTYSYRITKFGNVYDGHDWTAYDPKTSTTINISELGNYSLELRVKDEVNNIGKTSTNFSIEREEILFTSDREGNPEIYVMNSEGSNVIRLTKTNGFERNPSWSQDRNKIVFTSSKDRIQEIYLMNSDGSNQTQITNNVNDKISPVFSPNGEKIAYIEKDSSSKDTEIWAIDSDGSNPFRILSPGYSYIDLVWSFSNSKIAFTISDNLGGNAICTMNSDGSNGARLTSGSSKNPSWSPQGDKIAFTSYRDTDLEVYVMDFDGSNQINISNSSDTSDFNPSWSPDGTRIAYVSTSRYNSGVSATHEIWIMNSDGSNKTRLTNNSFSDSNPAWN